jgi:hypothetical protein
VRYGMQDSKNFCAHPYETAKTTLSNESDVVLAVSCKRTIVFFAREKEK